MKKFEYYMSVEITDDLGQTRTIRCLRQHTIKNDDDHDKAIAMFNVDLDHWCSDVEKFAGE
jgi:hypothetical protein